ncbi:MAG TPA: RNA-binding S4 domain-containing protein [Bacteroidia bacterium]|nr:RNA-binding S4 domain-containing protein [Sphingobacteriales bacterium]HPD64063.1 RNA-binding S4 domain-containing protein [Bacteroidia bacterium]HRS57803.1 RNA-binding S4 domain-containing protein [Bacteroidia bacterium]HRU67897.1 RNA-binding S4 domain-containing protein [Bacteroidia bacterium]
MKEIQSVRLDKYLWAVRIYKTRSLAAEACNGGKVKLNGEAAKPSKAVKENDTIELYKDFVHHQFRVIQLLEKRVGHSIVKDYLEDLTPPEEFENRKIVEQSAFYRPKGLGRPTKRERRLLDKIKGK